MLGELYHRYQEKLKAAGVMDFDDILLNMNYLLRDNPEALADIADDEEFAAVEATYEELMAAGDALAAKHYAVFNQNPELAAFLRKLDSLKRILGTKTTLILDTEATPFDIFKIKVGSLEQDNAPKK